MESIDIVIIGAGVIGAAIARECVDAGYQTIVLESQSAPASGASGSSAGIISSGFDREAGTPEARFMRDAAERWPQIVERFAIPFRRTGALALATTPVEIQSLAGLMRNAEANGVAAVPIDSGRLKRIEPAASGRAALLVPEEGVTDPFEVTRRLLGGVAVHYDARVLRVEQRVEQAALVRLDSTAIAARAVFNCAGLFADEIAADGSFQIVPVRGDFVVFAGADPTPLQRILRPVDRASGVFVFPTVYGHICAGPDSVEQREKDDWRPRGLREVKAKAAAILPLLSALAPLDAWAGLRTACRPHEYIIEWSQRVPSMLNVAGIRGTGLTACLGIAAHTLRMLRDRDILPRGKQLAVPEQIFDSAQPWWERHNRRRGLTA